MSNRIFLGAAITICIATAALFTEGHFSKAQDATHMDHIQLMHRDQAVVPTMPGQEVFGTMQEIVQILEADPHTDWSKVNIDALREHLIDMDEVVMRASADERVFDKGVEIIVTGEGRTLEAIKRMVPAHAQELSAIGWPATTEELSNGVKLDVTATDPARFPELKALGFVGILTLGSHHQLHHLMMAKGAFTHSQ